MNISKKNLEATYEMLIIHCHDSLCRIFMYHAYSMLLITPLKNCSFQHSCHFNSGLEKQLIDVCVKQRLMSVGTSHY